MGSIINGTKINLKLTPPPYTNKHEYVGSTNENTRDSQTHESENSPSDTDGYAINLDDEHKMKKMRITLTLNLKKMI